MAERHRHLQRTEARMTRLCAADLTSADFLSIIESHAWPEDALLMAFTPTMSRFERLVFDRAFLSQTEEGRVFWPAGELKWRRIQELLRVVYLGAPPAPPPLTDFSEELKGLSPCLRQYLLWGVRTDTRNEWLEQQVPHRFSYPIETAKFSRGRAAIVVEDWTDKAGIPRFSRYHSIIEVTGGE